MASESGGISPTTTGKQMSSKLREKLKRCGRYHCSPASSKLLRVAESPLAGTDNPVTPSPVSKTLLRTPRTKGKSDVQSRGGKRLFGLCSSDDSVVKMEHDVQCIVSCPKRCKQQGCEGHRKLCADRNGAKTSDLLNRCNSVGHEYVSITCNDGKHKCTSDSESVENVSDTVVSYPADHANLDTQLLNENTSQLHSLKCLHASLQENIEEKQETLRKLKMVKMYRTKNNLDHLDSLISKWRHVSQQALQDLHNKLPEPKPTMTELVNHLQIDHQLVNFNPDEESFD
ncbi:swi5-dependent recombination DNA repair protein 1 homolog [Liolophura sinensis]|uniref:swi5-dependent recombination DNA repair protein 1 homolog n=1 Tax=Liolophura sinensis TaxID=3198878 RepID=UPI0031586183